MYSGVETPLNNGIIRRVLARKIRVDLAHLFVRGEWGVSFPFMSYDAFVAVAERAVSTLVVFCSSAEIAGCSFKKKLGV